MPRRAYIFVCLLFIALAIGVLFILEESRSEENAHSVYSESDSDDTSRLLVAAEEVSAGKTAPARNRAGYRTLSVADLRRDNQADSTSESDPVESGGNPIARTISEEDAAVELLDLRNTKQAGDTLKRNAGTQSAPTKRFKFRERYSYHPPKIGHPAIAETNVVHVNGGVPGQETEILDEAGQVLATFTSEGKHQQAVETIRRLAEGEKLYTYDVLSRRKSLPETVVEAERERFYIEYREIFRANAPSKLILKTYNIARNAEAFFRDQKVPMKWLGDDRVEIKLTAKVVGDREKSLEFLIIKDVNGESLWLEQVRILPKGDTREASAVLEHEKSRMVAKAQSNGDDWWKAWMHIDKSRFTLMSPSEDALFDIYTDSLYPNRPLKSESVAKGSERSFVVETNGSVWIRVRSKSGKALAYTLVSHDVATR